MVGRVRWKVHARRETGENPEETNVRLRRTSRSKDYLSSSMVTTKMTRVSGISQTESQKASDMYMKCMYMDELTGGHGIVFATGTPISNSMTEMYIMMRYLQYGLLEQEGLLNFDAWASTFGESVTAIELAPEGYTLVGR